MIKPGRITKEISTELLSSYLLLEHIVNRVFQQCLLWIPFCL